MTIKYDIYENPDYGQEEKLLHARVVNLETVSTANLAQQIEYGTSLTQGDVKSVLASLSYQIVENLLNGKRVHIEGLGYFQLSIKGPVVKNRKEMRAEHLKIRSINFLPEKEVMNKFKSAHFERTKWKKHTIKYSPDEIEQKLREYFRENSYITRAKFQEVCGVTRSTSYNRINALVESGKLIKKGIKGFPIYEWKEEDRSE